MQQAVGFALAALIGLSLGILGGGGSILTVPIFVFVMGYTPKLAIAMSLPVVGVTSLVGAIGHWRAVDLRAALTFGVVAMIGALASARVAARVPGIVQLTLLGIVMLVAATLMLRPPRIEETADGAATGRQHPLLVTTAALGVGMLSGLVGIGGGFLFVPALVLLAGLPIKTAVGTSLLVIAMNTAAASLGYHDQVDIPWSVVAAFTAIAIVGSLSGARIVRFVPQRALRRAFAYFLFVMAAFILYQNRAVLAHPGAALRPSSAGTHAR
jgi:uncharacterized membrane protein YfcA